MFFAFGKEGERIRWCKCLLIKLENEFKLYYNFILSEYSKNTPTCTNIYIPI